MNRTQALERADEILDLFAEMYVSGAARDVASPCTTKRMKRFLRGRRSGGRSSTRPREIGRCTAELVRLTRRFAIRLEPVLLTVSEADTSILTVRRVIDREGA